MDALNVVAIMAANTFISFLLFTSQLLYVFDRLIPCVDELKSYHAGVDVTVTKDVRAEAGSYSHVVVQLKVQRETKTSDFNVTSQFDAVDF